VKVGVEFLPGRVDLLDSVLSSTDSIVRSVAPTPSTSFARNSLLVSAAAGTASSARRKIVGHREKIACKPGNGIARGFFPLAF